MAVCSISIHILQVPKIFRKCGGREGWAKPSVLQGIYWWKGDEKERGMCKNEIERWYSQWKGFCCVAYIQNNRHCKHNCEGIK